ncbi:MAG: SDR family NAD-dependent epimerase/dehydratase, partial [Cypionkella sp.]
NPGEFTMLELAEKVLLKLGSDLPITFMPLPQDDPRQRRPDISRAADLLGWAPTVMLDQGLDKTIAWFAQRLKSDRMKGSMVS